jgi:hypothetical protein
LVFALLITLRLIHAHEGVFSMITPRTLACLAILALATLLPAQTPPTAYTITQAIAGDATASMTIYRSGAQAVIEYIHSDKPDGTPGHRSLSFYDLKAGVSHTWDPAITPPSCSVGKFSGDWGDPFASTAELAPAIAKGDLKVAGSETLHGIPAKVYAGTSPSENLKVWFDEKDGLILRESYGAPGAAMQNMIDISKVSIAPPPASLFTMPAYCAGVKPPPTSAELIAEETGDSADNWVSASIGPGSKNTCSILLHVVAAKTMTPINRKYQVAIDTTFDQDHPSPYTFGVGDDGTATFSGGAIHEITNQVRNGMLRVDNPPPYFTFTVNVPTPHEGAAGGYIYRQCFAPVTNLYYILKDPSDPAKGTDFLYAKSGKYAAAPAH